MMIINEKNLNRVIPLLLKLTKLEGPDCAQFCLAVGYYMLGYLYFDDKVTWSHLEGVEQQAKLRAFEVLEDSLVTTGKCSLIEGRVLR